ncbi:MAG TPA: hypothetical protein VKG43_04955 [Acidimicrobiales bacterium]|nr:hypothetical protein [Acidimicrobiales bacterium]
MKYRRLGPALGVGAAAVALAACSSGASSSQSTVTTTTKAALPAHTRPTTPPRSTTTTTVPGTLQPLLTSLLGAADLPTGWVEVSRTASPARPGLTAPPGHCFPIMTRALSAAPSATVALRQTDGQVLTEQVTRFADPAHAEAAYRTATSALTGCTNVTGALTVANLTGTVTPLPLGASGGEASAYALHFKVPVGTISSVDYDIVVARAGNDVMLLSTHASPTSDLGQYTTLALAKLNG